MDALLPSGSPAEAQPSVAASRREALRLARDVLSPESKYMTHPSKLGEGFTGQTGVVPALQLMRGVHQRAAAAGQTDIANSIQQEGARLYSAAVRGGLVPGELNRYAAFSLSGQPGQPNPAGSSRSAAPQAAQGTAPAPAAAAAPAIGPTVVRVAPGAEGVSLTGAGVAPIAIVGATVTATNLTGQSPAISPHTHHTATKLPEGGWISQTTVGMSGSGFNFTGVGDTVTEQATSIATTYARRGGDNTYTFRAGGSFARGINRVWGAYRVDNPGWRTRGTTVLDQATGGNPRLTTLNELLLRRAAGLDLRTQVIAGANQKRPDYAIEVGLGQRAGLADGGGFGTIDPTILNGFPGYAAVRFRSGPTGDQTLSGRVGIIQPRWQAELQATQVTPQGGDATTTIGASASVRLMGDPAYQPPRIASGGPAPSFNGGISHLALSTKASGASLHVGATSNVRTGAATFSGTATYGWPGGAAVANVSHDTATNTTAASLHGSLRMIGGNTPGILDDVYIIGGGELKNAGDTSTAVADIGLGKPINDNLNLFGTINTDGAVKAGFVLTFR